MEGLKDYLEENLLEALRDNEALEHGLAEAIVQELGTDTTDYTEESLDSVLISYIMHKLSNRISIEIANMNYIISRKTFPEVTMLSDRQKEAMIPASIGYMLDLIEEDLTEQIDYIRVECFDADLLLESLESFQLNYGVEVAE